MTAGKDKAEGRGPIALCGLVHKVRQGGWIERVVVGGLKSAIDAHGPIDRQNISGAAKRVAGLLRAQMEEGFSEANVDEFLERLRQAHKKGGDAMRKLDELGLR